MLGVKFQSTKKRTVVSQKYHSLFIKHKVYTKLFKWGSKNNYIEFIITSDEKSELAKKNGFSL